MSVSINTYEVTVTHPDASGPLVVELIATNEAAAISRVRGAAVHMYRDLSWLDANYVISGVKAGVWPDGQFL